MKWHSMTTVKSYDTNAQTNLSGHPMTSSVRHSFLLSIHPYIDPSSMHPFTYPSLNIVGPNESFAYSDISIHPIG